jgi:hypothetical protein
MDPLSPKSARRSSKPSSSPHSPGITSPYGWGETETPPVERGKEANLADHTGKFAKSAASTAPTEALDIAQAAKETAQAAVEAASAQAAEFVSNVGDELGESAEKQKQQGADAIKSFARAIHRAGEEMDSQSPAVARQFHTAAGHVETLSDAIRKKSVPDLFASASNFARAQPAMFFAGVAVAGFVLARFIKSSGTSKPRDGIRPSGSVAAEDNGSWS